MKRAPLSWLQAFEATGRTGSFKAAAEELNVSPSTISHQVRDLEAYLEVLLFSRQHRRIELTREGANLLPELTVGFQNIRDASTQQSSKPRRLHIGAFPFFANEIVMPNMRTLKSLLPETEIRIYTQNNLDKLMAVDPNERLDLIVKYGPKHKQFTGFDAAKIADLSVVPLTGVKPDTPIEIDWLLNQPLIHVIGPFEGWRLWKERFAPNFEVLSFSLETDSYHAAMLSVARNEGVCLGVMPFISPWIEDGKVNALFEYELKLENHAAYAISASFQHSNPDIQIFVEWLEQQYGCK